MEITRPLNPGITWAVGLINKNMTNITRSEPKEKLNINTKTYHNYCERIECELTLQKHNFEINTDFLI